MKRVYVCCVLILSFPWHHVIIKDFIMVCNILALYLAERNVKYEKPKVISVKPPMVSQLSQTVFWNFSLFIQDRGTALCKSLPVVICHCIPPRLACLYTKYYCVLMCAKVNIILPLSKAKSNLIKLRTHRPLIKEFIAVPPPDRCSHSSVNIV